MTPEQRAYRNLWMRELGAPVPEWHQTKDEAQDARRRNAILAARYGTADEQPKAV